MATKPNKITERERSVCNGIREAVEAHLGTYDGNAVNLSLAFQMIAQAMETDDPLKHASCARTAIGLLISGGYLLEEPTKPMPVLES